jgi:hypothetical protein
MTIIRTVAPGAFVSHLLTDIVFDIVRNDCRRRERPAERTSFAKRLVPCRP